MPSEANQNLLFGILTLQLDFIRREQLVAATTRWLKEQSTSIEEILEEQEALSEPDRRLLAALVDRHIEYHDGDVKQSLAALRSIGSLRDELLSMDDPQLDATLSIVASDDRAREIDETTDGSDIGVVKASLNRNQFDGSSRFRILRPHAKGGLGEVSVAEDIELSREVALKEIQNRFADDPNSRSRFLLEAEVTGGLEHPGIVPVYGLGQYDDGRPYYAMRFIRGDSLKEAADCFHRSKSTDDAEQTLQLRKLLGRFIDVCNAIEYAHSRGVLHRDLKPGNIMLGKYGETLVVDWGLAKLKDHDDLSHLEGESTLRLNSGSGSAPTQMGTAIGTPAFMPPEQAAGRLDDLGPASDVYSLGATLYYLLTGRPAFKGESLDEMIQKVQEGKFSAPRSIKHDLPKALDAICLRAMATKPSDRYASPQSLADDVERFLADEAVSAHAESFPLRTRRWMRKHPRTIASVAAGLMVGLVSLITISSVVANKNSELEMSNAALVVANANEKAATQREALRREEAEAARREEAIARERAETVSKYMAGIFRSPDPNRLGETITVVELLEPAASQLAIEYEDEPVLRADLLESIAVTYVGLGVPAKAAPLLQKANDLYVQHVGVDSRQAIRTNGNLGVSYMDQEMTAKALDTLKQAHANAVQTFGPRDDLTLTIMNNLACAFTQVGDLDQARTCAEEGLSLARETFGDANEHVWIFMNTIAQILAQQGKMHESRLMQEEMLSGVGNPQNRAEMKQISGANNLGHAYLSNGELEKGIDILEAALVRSREIASDRHPTTISIMNNLGMAYADIGQNEKARQMLEIGLRNAREVVGENSAQTLTLKNNLALEVGKAGDLEQAIAMMEEVISRMEIAEVPDPWEVVKAKGDLGGMLVSHGETARGRLLMEDSLEQSREMGRSTHPAVIRTMQNLITAYRKENRREAALPLLEQVFSQSDIRWHDDLQRLLAKKDFLIVRRATGQTDGLVEVAEEALEDCRRSLGENDELTVSLMSELAAILDAVGQTKRAIEVISECYELSKKALGNDAESTLAAAGNLAVLLDSAGRPDEALQQMEQTLEQMREAFGENNDQTLTIAINFGIMLGQNGEFDRAISVLEPVAKRISQRWGPANDSTIYVNKQLANNYEQTGRYSDAEQVYSQEARRLRRDSANREILASVLSLLARSQIMQGKLADAETTLSEYQDAAENTGPGDLSLAVNTMRLGVVLVDQGKFEQAEPFLRKAVQSLTDPEAKPSPMRMRALNSAYSYLIRCAKSKNTSEGSREAERLQAELNVINLKHELSQLAADHPDRLKCMNSLGVMYWQLERLDQSIPLFEQVLDLREKKLGRANPQTLGTLANLGVNYKDAGRFKEAIPLLEEVQLASKQHQELAWVGNQLLDAYATAGETAKLTALLQKQESEARETLPAESPQLAGRLAALGRRFLVSKTFADAERLFRECLAIRETQQPDAWQTYNTKSMLGGALLGQDNVAAAEPLLVSGYQGMLEREQSIPFSAKQFLTEALERLVELYEVIGNENEATKWQAELDKR